MTGRCPRCDSPAPHLHPAVQHEGEVQECTHEFHKQPTSQNRVPVTTDKARELARECSEKLAEWKPTPEAINALPEPLRKYIHDIETNCDPAGMVRENVMLRDQTTGAEKELERCREEAQALVAAAWERCAILCEQRGLDHDKNDGCHADDAEWIRRCVLADARAALDALVADRVKEAVAKEREANRINARKVLSAWAGKPIPFDDWAAAVDELFPAAAIRGRG